MPFDGNGVYTPVGLPAFPPNNGDVISAPYYIQVIQDIASALSKVLLRDGSIPLIADFDLNSHAIKGLIAGSLASPAIRFQDDADTGFFLDGAGKLCLVVDGIKVATFTKDALTFWKAAPVAVAYASSIALDLSAGINFDIGTLTGNVTLANPTNTNLAVGSSGILAFTQDGTGGRTLSVGSNFKIPAGFALTPTPGITDLISYYVRSATAIYLAMAPGY